MQPTVMLVDDEADFLEGMKEFLEDSVIGIKVETFTQGKAALERLADGGVYTIVTDYNMPGMNGLDFLKNLEMLQPDIPRIMMTAMPNLELAMTAVNTGRVSYFFQKPVDPKQLAKAVSKLVWDHQGKKELGRNFSPR